MRAPKPFVKALDFIKESGGASARGEGARETSSVLSRLPKEPTTALSVLPPGRPMEAQGQSGASSGNPLPGTEENVHPCPSS